eukprot:347630-Rhodomonas_salina.1
MLSIPRADQGTSEVPRLQVRGRMLGGTSEAGWGYLRASFWALKSSARPPIARLCMSCPNCTCTCAPDKKVKKESQPYFQDGLNQGFAWFRSVRVFHAQIRECSVARYVRLLRFPCAGFGVYRV